jgi:uncharacterized protein with HEPN domain
MREQARDKGRLQDMIEAANNVEEFVAGVAFEQFVSNKMLFFAVMKNIEIIGEAAYMLTKEFQDSHSQVRWPVIIKMRHVIVHGYAKVSPEILWDTAINDVPKLKVQIQEFLSEYNNG